MIAGLPFHSLGFIERQVIKQSPAIMCSGQKGDQKVISHLSLLPLTSTSVIFLARRIKT